MRPLSWTRFLIGAMTLLPLCASADPIGYASGYSDLYRVDMASGQATVVGVIGFNDVEGLAFAPDGTLFGVVDATAGTGGAATDFLIRINPSSGQGTLVGPLGLAGQGPAGNLDYGLAFTCDGKLWASSDTTGELWEVNRSSGSAHRVGATGQAISGLAASPDGLFGISVGATPSLFRIDTTDASATLVGQLNVGGVVDDAGLDFASDGQLWAVLDPEPAAVGPSRAVRVSTELGRANLASTVNAAVGMEALAFPNADLCQTTAPVLASVEVPGPRPWQLLLLAVVIGMLSVPVLRSRSGA